MQKHEGFIIKWYHCFTNPFFFIRKGISDGVKRLAPKLKGDILDFGCGAKPYRTYFTNADKYIGLDIEVSGHDHKNENIDVYYDGKTIPMADKSFDHVFSTEVFEHIFNIDDVLPEIKRVMKSGGYLLITCPFIWPEHEKPYDFARYTSFGIKHILEKHGFAVREQIKTGNVVEVLVQQWMLYLSYFLPKKPAIVYYILHQIFLLPHILFAILLNTLMPEKLKKKDWFHNNIVLAEKID